MEGKSNASSLLDLNELLLIFVDIYSLPNFSDHIKDFPPNTIERKEKLEELQQMLNNIFVKLNQITLSLDINNFHAHTYNKYVDLLKTSLIENLKNYYGSTPTFMIISDINNKLDSKYLNLCEQLNTDMTSKLNEIKMEQTVKNYLKEMFEKFDRDGNGDITLEELEESFGQLGLPISMAKELMTSVDTLNDGKICKKEFEEYTEQHILKYYKIFFNLDSDNDGQLNYKQAKQSLHEVYPNLDIPEDVYKNLFNTMDLDKTELINFEEWCHFLLLFPQKNLKFMMSQWKLYSLTTIDPAQPSNVFIEKDIKYKHGHISTSYFEIIKIFFCGGVAGGVSRTITAPLERLKVLYQVMYTESRPPSIYKGLKDTYCKSGFVSLFKGNSLSICMSVLEQALRFAIIETSKLYMQDEYGNVKSRHYLFIGIITGILSTLIIFPVDVVRIRMISSSDQDIRVIDKIKKIHYNSGFGGFYIGLVPHLITVLPAGSLNVLFYNYLKKLFVTDKDKENPKVSKFMVIGGAAAYITGTITYPFTLLRSRIIVANKDIKIYKERIGLIKMSINTFKHEGLSGFFKGYSASILRLFIGQSFNFGTYEILKYYFVSNSNKKLKKKDS